MLNIKYNLEAIFKLKHFREKIQGCVMILLLSASVFLITGDPEQPGSMRQYFGSDSGFKLPQGVAGPKISYAAFSFKSYGFQVNRYKLAAFAKVKYGKILFAGSRNIGNPCNLVLSPE